MSKSNKKNNLQNRKLSVLARFGLGEERKYFVENLAMLLASGMNILSALRAIRVELKSVQMRKLVKGVEEDIESGSNLSRSLESTALFSDYAISLIRVGEESGRLSENLKILNQQQDKEKNISAKVRSATLYPIFVLAFTFIVVIFISWFVLPKLSSVFSSLRVELPLITRMIIHSGNFVSQQGLVFFPWLLVVVILLFYFLFFFKKTKFIGQNFLFSLPVVKDFIKQLQISRFGFILGSLLEAGLPIDKAIDSLISSTDFKKYKHFYIHLRDSIERGDSFQSSFKNYKKSRQLIPTPIQQLIVVGEQSGRLPQTLLNVSEDFEDKMENTSKSLTVLLEPVLLILIGLGVATIAMGVILPIYSLMDNINGASLSFVNHYAHFV